MFVTGWSAGLNAVSCRLSLELSCWPRRVSVRGYLELLCKVLSLPPFRNAVWLQSKKNSCLLASLCLDLPNQSDLSKPG